MIELHPDGDTCSTEHLELATKDAPVSDSLRLADHTTLRVGGPARRLVVARTEAEVVATVTDCDSRGEPVLILGGGSNLLIADEGFDGTVVRIATRGVNADVSYCGGALVKVAAGEVWDDFVQLAIAQEWVGVEALSGIPGLVGATPIQNVGAYGADVSQTIASMRTLDRQTGQFKTFPLVDCGFEYRMSRFKAEPGRYVVLEVMFQFELGNLSSPILYAELAARLGVEVGERAPAALVRETVLAIRSSKGMVLNAADHDTWSAGSFFTNPILDEGFALPAEAPRFPAGPGRIKTSAAWLIDHAGFTKGFGNELAALSNKHVLALTNRGGAKAADLASLARTVRAGVAERFGITLVPEPVLVGIEL